MVSLYAFTLKIFHVDLAWLFDNLLLTYLANECYGKVFCVFFVKERNSEYSWAKQPNRMFTVGASEFHSAGQADLSTIAPSTYVLYIFFFDNRKKLSRCTFYIFRFNRSNICFHSVLNICLINGFDQLFSAAVFCDPELFENLVCCKKSTTSIKVTLYLGCLWSQ